MSNMVINDSIGLSATDNCDTALATDPFTALKAHYGMLLGVADFQTIDAYHRGKQWLHSSWLHRQGVIWGFGVTLNADNNEIRVAPGLAIDALGRELHLSQAVCLNLPAWLESHKDEPEVQDAIEVDGNEFSLNAHVIIQFKACLSRQVPALMEPCDGGGASTAYSRVLETVEVILKPGPAPQVGDASRELPYHRLRLLFNLEDTNEEEGGGVGEADQHVLDLRASILILPVSDQPKAYLEALRKLAALDSLEMRPAQTDGGEAISNFPAIEPASLVIADLSDVLIQGENVISGEVDNTVRDTHIATSTIQELLCGPLFGALHGADGEVLPNPKGPIVPEVEDAGGPRIDPASVVFDGSNIKMTLSHGDLLVNSLVPGASVFAAIYRGSNGWVEKVINNVNFDSGSKKVEAELADVSPAELNQGCLRIIIKGTGLTPAVATTARIPLAGSSDGPPGTTHDGHDFVYMIKLEGLS